MAKESVISVLRLNERLVMDIVKALCAHYETRRYAVENKLVSKRVSMEYVYVNSKMFIAAGEIAGARYAEQFIKEIGGEIGYSRSEIDAFSESAYKTYKREIKRNIAIKLCLLDESYYTLISSANERGT